MDPNEQENSSIHKDANTRMTLNDLFLLHLQNEEKRFLKDSKITKCAPFKRSYNVSCLSTMIFFALRRVIMHYDVELMVFKLYYTFIKEHWFYQFKVWTYKLNEYSARNLNFSTYWQRVEQIVWFDRLWIIWVIIIA